MFDLAMFLQIQPDPAAIRHVALAILAILPIIILVALVIVIVPFWFICKKAGFSPWLSFLNVIPFGNLILLYVIAFSDWKVMPVPQAYWPQPPGPPPSAFPPPPSAFPPQS